MSKDAVSGQTSADSCCSPASLVMLDRPSVISVDTMRGHFERMIRETPRLRDTPLGTMEVNGSFHHYMDGDTDTMWIGFAPGMRVAQRLANPEISGTTAAKGNP